MLSDALQKTGIPAFLIQSSSPSVCHKNQKILVKDLTCCDHTTSGEVRILILQPGQRQLVRNFQYRRYDFIATVNPCENCDVVAEWQTADVRVSDHKKNIAFKKWQVVPNAALSIRNADNMF